MDDVIQITTLSQLEILPSSHLHFQSEKYVCNLHQDVSTIYDLNGDKEAENRIHSPVVNQFYPYVATRDGKWLRVFNENRDSTQIAFCEFDEEVVYHKWITDSKLAVVTRKSVFHLSAKDSAKHYATTFAGKKVFSPLELQRIPMFPLNDVLTKDDIEITNYWVDPSQEWMILMGKEKPLLRSGFIQIVNAKTGSQNLYEASAAAVAFVKDFGGSNKESFILARASTKALCVTQLGSQGAVSESWSHNTPVVDVTDISSLELSSKYNLLYIISQHDIQIYSLPTGVYIRTHKIVENKILSTVVNSSGGFYALNEKGEVLNCDIDETVFGQILKGLNDEELAVMLVAGTNVPGLEDLVEKKWSKFFNNGEYEEASLFATKYASLRTKNIVDMLKSAPVPSGKASWLLIFLALLLSQGKQLNEVESLEYFNMHKKEYVEKLLNEKKLTWEIKL